MAFLGKKGANMLASAIRSLTTKVSAVESNVKDVKTTADAAIPKMNDAVDGNVAIVNGDGTVADGGIKFSMVESGLLVTYDDGK